MHAHVKPRKSVSGAMPTPSRKPFSLLRNQGGMALILALGMLAFVSLLGAVVLMAVNRGFSSLGQAGAKTESFIAAERGVEYSLNRQLILSMSSSVDLMTAPHENNINAGDSRGHLTAGTVRDSGPGLLPVRLAELYGNDFGANYYDVSVTAEGPRQVKTRIDTQVVRLYKLDDDAIFRTTGGGG